MILVLIWMNLRGVKESVAVFTPTAFMAQKRLVFAGHPMFVLPIRVL